MATYVLAFNITTMPQVAWHIPKEIMMMHNMLRLDQFWNMFAPYPLKYDGWHVMRGKLRDGTVVDLLSGDEREPGWEKPEYAHLV